jgi:hypothetical protein
MPLQLSWSFGHDLVCFSSLQDYLGGRYGLGDLLEMAGYGLVDRVTSNVRVSGMHTDPHLVRQSLTLALDNGDI